MARGDFPRELGELLMQRECNVVLDQQHRHRAGIVAVFGELRVFQLHEVHALPQAKTPDQVRHGAVAVFGDLPRNSGIDALLVGVDNVYLAEHLMQFRVLHNLSSLAETSQYEVNFVRHFPALVKAGHVHVAMPPLFRIDLGKETFYALDEEEKKGLLERFEAEHKRGKPQVTRFKGLGEMNPLQLRETTMNPDTRRLVQLVNDDEQMTNSMMDMLLAKKRAPDRKEWLELKGNLADV